MNDYQFETYDEFVHVSELEKYEEAKWYLSEMLKALYQSGSVEQVENNLEEVLAVFDMKMPTTSIKIR